MAEPGKPGLSSPITEQTAAFAIRVENGMRSWYDVVTVPEV